MTATYQDVVRANGALVSWAFTEASGTSFAPWLGSGNLTGSGGFTYQQPGPFASSFSLGLAIGAKLVLPLVGLITVPNTFEAWVRIPGAVGSPNQLVWAYGAAGTNGAAGFVNIGTSHVETVTGATVADTGQALSASGFHLLQWTWSLGPTLAVFVDGIPVYQQPNSGGPTPVPLQLAFGGDNARGAAQYIEFAYPAFYARGLTMLEAQANYLAITDPDAAITFTPGGQALAGGQAMTMLQSILDAVTIRAY